MPPPWLWVRLTGAFTLRGLAWPAGQETTCDSKEGHEMAAERARRGGRPRKQGWTADPLVTVSVHLRKSQLASLDQLANAEHTSRAELVREAIDLLLKCHKRP